MSRLIATLAILSVAPLAFATTADLVQQATVTLPLVRRYNLTSVHNLLRHDQARGQTLRSGRPTNDQIDNQAVAYLASVEIGEGPNATTYSLVVDTGSSNTWAGAGKEYIKTGSTEDTGDLVFVSYGSGLLVGEELIDRVTLAPDLVVERQSVGDAIYALGFNADINGILGLGPTNLTIGTLLSDQSAPIPTVPDNLYKSGAIRSNEFAVYFQPIVGNDTSNGEITFGGSDRSKATCDIQYTPVTVTQPSSQYWGINQTITYGKSTMLLSNKAGVVDTGTTLLLMATDAFDIYKNVTGAVLDNVTGLLSITEEQYSNLNSLHFTIGTSTFELNADGQLWPRRLNTLIGGNSSAIYLIVGDLGVDSSFGLTFINGYSFLERFYSIYDSTNNRLGFATTAYTNSKTNFLI